MQILDKTLNENESLKEKVEELQRNERESEFKMKKMREEIENLMGQREHYKQLAILAEDKMKAKEQEIVEQEMNKMK